MQNDIIQTQVNPKKVDIIISTCLIKNELIALKYQFTRNWFKSTENIKLNTHKKEFLVFKVT